jgi:hypothetical protein
MAVRDFCDRLWYGGLYVFFDDTVMFLPGSSPLAFSVGRDVGDGRMDCNAYIAPAMTEWRLGYILALGSMFCKKFAAPGMRRSQNGFPEA